MKFQVAYLLVLFLLVSCSKKSGSIFSIDESEEIALDFSDSKKIHEHYQRGKYITNTVGACGHCHGSNLGGGLAPNITSDSDSGIGNWKVNQIVELLKTNKRDNGSFLYPDTHLGLIWISDYDARSIAIYLLTTKPIKIKTEKKESSSMMDVLSSRPNVKGYVLHPKENANASYGRYLALNLASCQTCHGVELSGLKSAPRLKGRISKWSKEQIINYFRTGKTPKGKKVNPESCSWPYYRLANVSDQQAMAFFLKNFK